MIIFTDENLSPSLIQMLQLCRHKKKKHIYLSIYQAPFSRQMPDEESIRLLQQQVTPDHPSIIAFSGDHNILRSKTQSQILKQAGFNYVLATDKFFHLPWPEQAWRYLRAWPHLQKDVEKRNGPAVYKMYRDRAA